LGRAFRLNFARGVIGTILLVAVATVTAADYDTSALSDAMARAMTLMMETMARMANKRGGGALPPDYTWPPPGWEHFYDAGRPPFPPYPPPAHEGPPVSILEGTWLGNAGDILVIHGVRFRIFMDEAHFTEGIFRIDGNLLTMTNLENHTSRIYEFAMQQGRLVLRDADGNLMLYKRFSREAFANPFRRFRGEALPPPPAAIPQTDGAAPPAAIGGPDGPLSGRREHWPPPPPAPQEGE